MEKNIFSINNPAEKKKVNEITEKIIGCAITIHKTLGPGLLESIYESAMCIELKEVNLHYECKKPL